MAEVRKGYFHLGFFQTFVLPALLVFLLPTLSLFFFLHAENKFDAEVREDLVASVQSNPTFSEDDRQKAVKLFTEFPFSQLVDDENLREMITPEARFHYFTFRWMIILSFLSILFGILYFMAAGLSVVLSYNSQRIQHLVLAIGWPILKLYSALQLVVQGLMLFALSYWVTALWFNIFIPKLIFIVGLLVVIAVGVVLLLMFKRINIDQPVEGVLADPQDAAPLLGEINALCEQVGATPPDNVVLGIDDKFYLTENPTLLADKKLKGRTLCLSLAMLKYLDRAEASALLSHELAHFSGKDTFYSRKIAPRLLRIDRYLQALYDGVVTLPVFYFMNSFRTMCEYSLGRIGRKREQRADRIAAENSSPINFAQGLLRSIAYAELRDRVQEEIFKSEEVLKHVDISEQIDSRFHEYLLSFGSRPDVGRLENRHPYDIHLPLDRRLEALGIPCDEQYILELLKTPGDGGWYDLVNGAFEIEREQWDALEEKFRERHEQSLAYRFMPETDNEREIVVKAFPEVKFEGKDVLVQIDYSGVQFGDWPEPVKFSEFIKSELNETVLTIHYLREGKKKHTVKLKPFGNQPVLDTINKYLLRYEQARDYQKHKKATAAT